MQTLLKRRNGSDRFPGLYPICLLIIILSVHAHAGIRLPRLIGDGMVLQRNTEVEIWGWADEYETVTLHFLGSIHTATPDPDGRWRLTLSGLEAGGPHRMRIVAGDTLTIDDILIGDVWVCSGQSQMDITMDRVSPLYPDEIRSAGNPMIRYFSVPTAYDFRQPREDLSGGEWVAVRPDNILGISAVAYFFADELFARYRVPVGIIRSSLGGSPAEAWISGDALREFPVHHAEAQRFKNTVLIDSLERADRRRSDEWHHRMNRTDEGYRDPGLPWHRPEAGTTGWDVMEIPGYWADGDPGRINGVLWFRKDITLPESLSGKPAKLLLGRIVDADSVFVNGVYVGSTGYQYPPRRYDVPPDLLRKGENTIVIRLISYGGKGGFVPDKPYELIVEDLRIGLEGKWRFRVGAKMEPLRSQTFVRFKPVGLFNGMIAPLTRYAIKGVIWYQGESNTGRPLEYRTLFPALIRNWREEWGRGDFPFLFVQLHNYMESHDHPTESNWALTREAQAGALALPNTGMAVAIDLGEWNDIHPLNKKDVSKRLALAAREIVYHESGVVGSGPRFRSMEIEGNRLILTFSGVGSGLIAKGNGELKHFAVAGEDRRFVWAKAVIDGERLIVWSDEVPNPVAVRYAWADNPDGANLYNREGLPASPFRTDDWMPGGN
ncbi:MAG TPA: sialate O-acetylesterase [bacterium]|nr:sialate O-acetylesterase [bacterium]